MPAPTHASSDGVAWETHRDTVQPDWIDYNGHMNVAFYVLVFDRSMDAFLDRLGIGSAYRARSGRTIFAAELHVTYKSEVKLGDPLKAESLLLGADAKRVHVFQRLFHADTNALIATCESLGLNVDQTARRVVPFTDDVVGVLAGVVAAHAITAPPPEVGRRIAALAGSRHFTLP